MKLTQEFGDQRQLGSFADPQTHLTGEFQFQCRLGLRCRDFDESGGRSPSVVVVGSVSDGPKTDETCRFENRVLAGGSKTPSEGCSDGGVRLDWFSVQGGLIWSLVQ